MVKDIRPHPYELYFSLAMENHLRKRACVVLSIHSQSKVGEICAYSGFGSCVPSDRHKFATPERKTTSDA
jgi:hypothetical protein